MYSLLVFELLKEGWKTLNIVGYEQLYDKLNSLHQ